MKKYIIFFILSLFLGQEVMAKEGMPQLNPEFWLSQIFWLIIFFGFLYFLIHKFFSPKLFSLIDQRADFLKSLINETENNKNQIQKLEDLFADSGLRDQNAAHLIWRTSCSLTAILRLSLPT